MYVVSLHKRASLAIHLQLVHLERWSAPSPRICEEKSRCTVPKEPVFLRSCCCLEALINVNVSLGLGVLV